MMQKLITYFLSFLFLLCIKSVSGQTTSVQNINLPTSAKTNDVSYEGHEKPLSHSINREDAPQPYSGKRVNFNDYFTKEDLEHPEFGKVKLAGSPESMELPHMREVQSRTFINPDGSYSKMQVNGYLNYKDEQGRFLSINNRLSKDERNPIVYKIEKTDLPIESNIFNGQTEVHVDKKNSVSFGEEVFQIIKDKNGNEISRTLMGQGLQSTIDSATILLHEAWQGIDRQQNFNYGSVKTNYIINNKPTLPISDGYMVFEEKVVVPSGWKIIKDSTGEDDKSGWKGKLIVLNSERNIVAYYDMPVISEYMGEPKMVSGETFEIDSASFRSRKHREFVPYPLIIGRYNLKNIGNEYFLSVAVPIDWLLEPSRKYPVLVDPKITVLSTVAATYGGDIPSCYFSNWTATMAIAIPANSYVTNTLHNITYAAINGAYLDDGIVSVENLNLSNWRGWYGLSSAPFTNVQGTVGPLSFSMANCFYAAGPLNYKIYVQRDYGCGTCACDLNYIYVNWTSGGGWAVTVTYFAAAPVPAVANDNWAAASNIPLTTDALGNITGSLAGQSTSLATADNPVSYCFAPTKNVWYKFTTPAAGTNGTGNYFIYVKATGASPMVSPAISLMVPTSCTGKTEYNCASNGGRGSSRIANYPQSGGFPNIRSAYESTTYAQISTCGLAANTTYLIDVDAATAGTFDIYIKRIYYDKITTAQIIDECGFNFVGSTIGATDCEECSQGPSGGGAGSSWSWGNLDCNTGTNRAWDGCIGLGEVPFSVENNSWFTFSLSAAGNYNITLANIANCFYGTGLQLAIFSGSSGNLTYITSIGTANACYAPALGCVPQGSSWSSGWLAFSSGVTYYIMVDGSAGDNCDYTLTINPFTTCAVLPISLLDFDATCLTDKVHVTWSTASESNNDYFILERSKDGIHFSELSRIEGAGTSSSKNYYEAWDYLPENGESYYRLKQVDFNGDFSYSKNITTSCKGKSGLNVSAIIPVPADNYADIYFSTDKEEKIVFDIYDLLGNKVIAENENAREGGNIHRIDLTAVSGGMYYITVKNSSGSYSGKLIKK